MLKFRICDYFPDEKFGFAISMDEGLPRKIFVHDKEVSFGKLQIAALIECEIEPSKPRWQGRKIRVIR